MDLERPILRVGLTGGIASGKTTVAHVLAEQGAFVVDADDLAHAALAREGAAHASVVQRFGRGILDAEGNIDRVALARLVFHDRRALGDLNEIVHPLVRAEADRRIVAYAREGRAPIAVLDAALLVETGAHRECARLIVVRCGIDVQVERLIARGVSLDEARARIAAQAPLEAKLAVADYVVDTSGTLRETREQTERVYAHLLADFEREFGSPREDPSSGPG